MSAAPTSGPPPLRVATFNLRSGLAWDGLHSWPLRARLAAEAVAGLDADLAGLQEVHGFQQRSLLRRLDEYAAVGAPRGDGRRRGERVPLFYRPARLRLESHETRWLSPTPHTPGSLGWGNLIPRIVTLAVFSDRVDGSSFGVANTHWDGASPASRRLGARALLEWLDPSLAWIVTGDLNATPDDEAVRRLYAGGLRDTLNDLPARGAGVATHHQFTGSTVGTRIDFILVSARWDVLAASIEHPRPRGRLASDHWPVVAVLHLRHHLQTPDEGDRGSPLRLATDAPPGRRAQHIGEQTHDRERRQAPHIQ